MPKLNLHYQNTTSWMRRVHFASEFVKMINPPEDARDIFPDKKIIGRIYMTDGAEGAFYTRGKQGGADYFAHCLPLYRKAPGIHAYEAWNEPAVIHTPQERAALCAATVEWARLMHERGYRVVVGNFSERNPADGTIAEFAPMLDVADYVSFHCYGAPRMTTTPDRLTLRYRQLAGELSQAGVPIPKVLLGETGIDMGIVGLGRKGWQKSPGLDWAGYFADLRWYEAELAKDAYIVGAFLFSAGASKDWQTFDISEKQAAELAAWQRAYTPQPQPAPTIDGPRAFLGAPLPVQTQKLRWYLEETKRQMETGHYGEADTVIGDLIPLAGEVERKTR